MKMAQKIIMKLVPLVIVVAVLPFALSFDSLMYWLTRPSCLNCGSLVGFLQTNSLTAGMIVGLVGQVKIGRYSFGRKR